MRESFYPALFEEMRLPYTGSDAYTMTLTLDKWLTKLVLEKHGIDTPRAELVNASNLAKICESGPGLAFPVIIKPNYEGSSKGIGDNSVVRTIGELAPSLKAALKAFPEGVLIEEYIEGIDVAVGYLVGVGHDSGLLQPVETLYDNSSSDFNVYDFRRKTSTPTRFACVVRQTFPET